MAEETRSGRCEGMTCVLTNDPDRLTKEWKLWTLDSMDVWTSDPTMIAILILVLVILIVVLGVLVFYCVKRGCAADLQANFNGLCIRFRTICGTANAGQEAENEPEPVTADLIELA